MLLHIWYQWGEFTLHFCQPKCHIQSRRGWCALYNEKVISHTVYKHTHSLLRNIVNRKNASVFRKILQNVILLFYRILFIYSTLCYLLRTCLIFIKLTVSMFFTVVGYKLKLYLRRTFTVFSKACDDLIISLITIFSTVQGDLRFCQLFIIFEPYFSRCTLEHLRKGNSSRAAHARREKFFFFYVIPSFHCIKNKVNGCLCGTCLRKIARNISTRRI